MWFGVRVPCVHTPAVLGTANVPDILLYLILPLELLDQRWSRSDAVAALVTASYSEGLTVLVPDTRKALGA